MNKQKLVAIFAHPDDEAFGPGGTLALYAKTHDTYLICVTHGEAGHHHNGDTTGLGSVREKNYSRLQKFWELNRSFV